MLSEEDQRRYEAEFEALNALVKRHFSYLPEMCRFGFARSPVPWEVKFLGCCAIVGFTIGFVVGRFLAGQG